MYLYSVVNSINEGFIIGSLFGVMIVICLGWLTGCFFATTKAQFIGNLIMFLLCCLCTYLILITGALQ